MSAAPDIDELYTVWLQSVVQSDQASAAEEKRLQESQHQPIQRSTNDVISLNDVMSMSNPSKAAAVTASKPTVNIDEPPSMLSVVARSNSLRIDTTNSVD